MIYMHHIDKNRPIGALFEDESFKAFVYDFYFSHPDMDYETSIGEIYREILSDVTLYRDFLYYCKTHNFSFVAVETWLSPEVVLHLWILQRLRETVAEKIQYLLHIPQWDIYESMLLDKPTVLKWKTKWEALQEAVGLWVPVNTYGEVIYIISKFDEGYRVYSDESWVHEIDFTGKVLCDTTEEKENMRLEWEKIKNRSMRRQVLMTLQKVKRFQKIVRMWVLKYESDTNIYEAMIQMFEKETASSWKEVEGDPKEERVYKMKLQSYVFFKLVDLEKEYENLQEADTFAKRDIVLVWWTDLGD